MTAFRYEALDGRGAMRKGVLEADGARQGRAQLRRQGLVPCRLEPAQPAAGGGAALRLSLRRRALVLQQLATLLGARLGVDRALEVLIFQAPPQEREALASVRSDVLGGSSLAQALERFPRAFDEIERTLVAAGEASGQLPEVMRRLADYAAARASLQSSVGLALLYPLVVTLVAAAVMTVLLVQVVPQVAQATAAAGVPLPALTRAMIAAGDAVRAAGAYAILGAILAAVLLRRAWRRPGLRGRVHARLLAVPLLGPLLRADASSRMAETLAMLTGNGVPMLKALRASAGVVRWLPMRQALQRCEEWVREGVALSRALERTGQFPPLLVHLAASGEASGTLGSMLERAAQAQRQGVEQGVQALARVLEPVLVLAMGALVLLIVLAALLPILDLNLVLH